MINELLFFSSSVQAGETLFDLSHHWIGYACLAIFILAYLLVMAEEFIHLRKSKPMIIAAGLIWALVAYAYRQHGGAEAMEAAIRHDLTEYAELLLFLLVAMTYINAMDERRVFDRLRAWLIQKGFGLIGLFWITGLLTFLISPIADNLTTALLMCSVALSVSQHPQFILLSCINIVVAANAGGVFSPFGDITTLMIWQKEIPKVDFWSFFYLFIPALVNWLLPAAIMSFYLPKESPQFCSQNIRMRRGAKRIILLFLMTITTAIFFHNFLSIPPVIGMMTGLGYLQIFGFYLKKSRTRYESYQLQKESGQIGDPVAFDVFEHIARAEWDTLLFFYGIVLCVGGLNYIGYLSSISELFYQGWGATQANISVGLLSAVVDNIPVTFAVLTMMPDMSLGQWLLLTLTAGVGGSLLSIGSAAGVSLMGQARGRYTFFGHLKWTPVIALGYAASIATHYYINQPLFSILTVE